jgi:hypothetical protein
MKSKSEMRREAVQAVHVADHITLKVRGGTIPLDDKVYARKGTGVTVTFLDGTYVPGDPVREAHAQREPLAGIAAAGLLSSR